MDATQAICDSFVESDEETSEEEDENKRGKPIAKLCILKNDHVPVAEMPLFLGDNIIGRDPNTCTVALQAPSVSKQHATICITVHGRRGFPAEADIEALVWDRGSMNGTRKGRLKLTPNVRYALSEGDSLVVADIPCQYVSCVLGSAPSQGDMRTPVSRSSGVKARLADASGVESSADSGKNGTADTKASAMVPLSGLGDTRKTPFPDSCLSFEKTPAQPQRTLVSESDSDSDGERQGRGARIFKAIASDSDSHKSSPNCSSFLSPTNKVVPESEDESPITPSSSTKGKPHRHVSFSNDKSDIDAGRQQLKNKETRAFGSDSEEEEGREEERGTLGGAVCEESGQDVPVKQKSDTSLEEKQLSAPTNAIPVFNMDSDTDVEDEGEPSVSANQQADQPLKTAQFNMDSDTDVEAEEEVGASVRANQQADQPPNTAQFNMDSDTDVEEEGASVGPVSANQQTDQPPNTAQFNMDSDTDVEEEVASVGPVSANQQTDQPPNTAQFNMDSDTDVEEEVASVGPVSVNQPSDQQPNTTQFHMDSETDVDEDVVPKCVSSSADNTKPSHAVPLVEPMDINLDSDTDVDDEADEAKPASPLAAQQADSASSTQPKDFHLDSDTDVDEEEEKKCGTSDNTSKIEEGPTRIDSRPAVVSESAAAAAAPHSGNVDSDTDEEAIPAPVDAKPPDVSATVAGLDSDTDAEEESTRVTLISIHNPAAPETSSAARQCDADVDIDLDVSSVTPAGDGENATQQGRDSDTDVDDKEADPGKGGKNETPNVPRGKLPLLQAPLLQQCSTPVQVSEQEIEDMDTQAFLSPSVTPLRRGVKNARMVVSSSCSESLDEEDYTVAETQSFVCPTRASPSVLPGSRVTGSCGLESPSNKNDKQSSGEGSFQLGLSDSSYLRGQAQALAMEDTQAFVSAGGGVTMEETQAYAVDLTAGGSSTSDDSNSEEPTQAYGDLASLATQAYTSKPDSDSEDEFIATAETQFLDPSAVAAIAVAETLPMCGFGDEESLATEISPVHVASSDAEVTDKQGESGNCQDKSLGDTPTVTETQPMDTRGKKDLNPDEQSGSEQPLRAEEETHPTTSAGYSASTQPMVDATLPIARSENEESNEEDSIPAPRKRKAKKLRLEDEESQRPSQTSTIQTQPLDADEDEESEDLILGPRKRKAKPLEESQSLVSSAETQPMVVEEEEQEDGSEDPILAPRRGRKSKQLRLEDEETQKLVIAETQPMDAGGDEDSEEPNLCRPRRKAKPLHFDESQSQTMNAGEDVENGTKESVLPQQNGKAGTSGVSTRGKRSTRAKVREEEERPETPKRQTRGSKAPPATKGRRTRSRHAISESEEEEEKVEEVKPVKGKRATKQKKNCEEADEENHAAEQERCEREKREEQERKEKAEQEKIGAEMAEKERVRILQEQKEKERRQQEEKEKAARIKEEKEQLERAMKEKSEKQRLEREAAEREEKARLEREERKRREQEEKQRLEREKAEKEQKEREERERQEREEKERLEREKAEREEKAREERERKEQEEKERLEREKAEREKKAREERERREREEKAKREEKARLEREERERREREKERLEREKAEREEKARLEREVKERREQEEKKRLQLEKAEREAKERLEAAKRAKEEQKKEKERRERLELEAKEKETLEKEKAEGGSQTKTPARGRRAARRTAASEPPPDDDVPARRTRSRSNSSNSVSSERSASSSTQGKKGQAGSGPAPRGRRRTAAARPDAKDPSPPPTLSRSNSSNSLNSEVSGCSVASQSRGRGGRQRGRGRATEPHPPADQNATPKPAAGGRRRGRAEEKEAVDAAPPAATRGRRRADDSHQTATEGPSTQNDGAPQVRGQTAVKDESVEEAVAPGNKGKATRKARKRELETSEEKASDENPGPAVAKRKGRASKSVQEPSTEVKEEAGGREEPTERPSQAPKTDNGEGATPAHHADGSTLTLHTPVRAASRKRQTTAAAADSSPLAKTPRSSAAAAANRLRAASQSYKVLFTGVEDEEGQRVLARLGGVMAKGMADMNCLVTDKVRRTVKFLCAVAKGIPIVNMSWLEQSGHNGSFLPPTDFLVDDPEQEKKFNFCLRDSLGVSSSQPLLQGYKIHITKSVKPEPAQMKDIVACSGAAFLSKMPSSYKPQTVVISCEDDWSLCGPALSASLPVVSAEFVLTGILRQKVDFETHKLSAPTAVPTPAGGKGAGRKRT